MRSGLLISCLLLGVAAGAAAQARAGLAITVTDAAGAALAGVAVEVLGDSDRGGVTDASGGVTFTGMQPGTYRMRLSGDDVIAFEREVTLRAGETAEVDVTLTPAPREPIAALAVGPSGQPLALSIVDLVERELISDDVPRRETLVACSGNTRTTLIQLNEPLPERLYDTAEATYYVVAGEGALSLNGRETALAAGSFVSLPRETAHSLVRRGRRPLIVLATLSGAPCEQAR